MFKIHSKGDLSMSMAKASLKKSALGFFIGAMCIMYPQQISQYAMKVVVLFSDMFVKIFTGPFLKALGI